MSLGADWAVVAHVVLFGGVLFVALDLGLLGLAKIGNRVGVELRVPWISMGLAALMLVSMIIALMRT